MCGSLPCIVELGTSTPSGWYHFSCLAFNGANWTCSKNQLPRTFTQQVWVSEGLKRLLDSFFSRTMILAHAIQPITVFTLWLKVSKHYKLISVRKAKGCSPALVATFIYENPGLAWTIWSIHTRNTPPPKKKGLLPWCRGWLGLVIGSFGSAGGVVDMPRVPDGRAGVYNRAGLFSRGWGQ